MVRTTLFASSAIASLSGVMVTVAVAFFPTVSVPLSAT